MVVTGVAGHNTQVNFGGYLLGGADKVERERHPKRGGSGV